MKRAIFIPVWGAMERDNNQVLMDRLKETIDFFEGDISGLTAPHLGLDIGGKDTKIINLNNEKYKFYLGDVVGLVHITHAMEYLLHNTYIQHYDLRCVIPVIE